MKGILNMANIKDKFLNFTPIVWILDIINFFRFIFETKKSKKTDILFNELNLDVNSIGNIIYMQINCTEEELQENGYSPIDMVFNKIKPQVDYINTKWWAKYIVPQITNFTDEDDNMTLSYLVLFIFYPIKFSIKSLFYVVLSSGIFTGLYFLIKWYIETYM